MEFPVIGEATESLQKSMPIEIGSEIFKTTYLENCNEITESKQMNGENDYCHDHMSLQVEKAFNGNCCQSDVHTDASNLSETLAADTGISEDDSNVLLVPNLTNTHADNDVGKTFNDSDIYTSELKSLDENCDYDRSLTPTEHQEEDETSLTNVSTLDTVFPNSRTSTPSNADELRMTSSSSESGDDEEELVSYSSDMQAVRKKFYQNGLLEWVDSQHQADTMHCLNVFRRSRQFCDLVILIGGREIHCHRVVVGGASSAIFDELSQGEQESGPLARIPLDDTLPGLIPDAVDILVDFMYTSKLSIPSTLLTAVYNASLQLGVERVTPLCRRYIMARMDVDQCVPMRRLALGNGDHELKEYVDTFVEDNFRSVASCNELLALPRIKMDISGSPETSFGSLLVMNGRDGTLSAAALAWIRSVIEKKCEKYLQELTEQIQRVSLDELNNASLSNTNNHNWRQEDHKTKEASGSNLAFSNSRLARSSSLDSLNSSDSIGSGGHLTCCLKGEWSVIASTQTAWTEHMIALCCVGDVLCTLSIHLPNVSHLQVANVTNGLHHHCMYNNANVSVCSSSASCSSSNGSGSQIPPLLHARCAAGVATVNGKILVAGGFDKSECLDSVECFDPGDNRWSVTTKMSQKRARFAVGVLRGRLYAVGGSSGSHDHISVDCYDPAKNEWTQAQPLLTRCSEAGVAVLNDRLYCVGGVQQSRGVAGIKDSQVYDPDKNEWQYISSMHTGRCSLGVASLKGHLYAVAGSDGWNCMATTERFDPLANEWTHMAALNVQRRGLGLTGHNGALYCAGGSDGHSFLSSMERYCPEEGDTWTVTLCALAVPRNNVGLTSLNGNIFAVGGFSGRNFLTSVEILEDGCSDWSDSSTTTDDGTSPAGDGHKSNENNV